MNRKTQIATLEPSIALNTYDELILSKSHFYKTKFF